MLIAGANVAECFPVMTHYVWGARDRGATLIVVDPRETPLARTADLHVPLRPGTDAAFFNAVLHVHRARGLARRCVHRGADRRVGGRPRGRARLHARARAAEICGIDAGTRSSAPRTMWGTAERAMAFHARGVEHQIQGVENALRIINLVLATGQIGAGGKGYGTITGQGNGQGGREHGQKADQLPGARDIENPEHRAFIADFWGIDEADLPHAGVSAVEIVHLMETGEIRGFLALCNNPFVSMPNASRIEACYERLEFHVQLDFFLSETAARADVVLPSTTWAEEGGTTTNAEGRVILRHRAADPPGEARPDWWIIDEIARAARRRRRVRLRLRRGDLRGTPRGLEGRRRRLLRHHLRASRGDRRTLLARARARITRGRHGCSRSGSTSPTGRRASTPSSGTNLPSPSTTSTRSGSRRAGPSRTSCPGTRPGGSARSSNRRRAHGSRCIPRSGSRRVTPYAS